MDVSELLAGYEAREQTLETEWPKRELERLRTELAARTGER